ncbi:histidine kinase [Massilia sp. PAMC28688]|uniref:sensor histidine kinase n=1 Tax=Massilia sp. PAMC28688 TaxID=2861283 RepID=UPI001C624F81|nr:histidine kinase [Massilia sp. PAMC28688]QYF94306.1 histidine kinase [Massilia sp. PAMC28688]
MQASQINKFMDLLRDVVGEARVLWWNFFDWLAVVEWRKLNITCALAVLVGAMFQVTEPAISFALISIGVKTLAGGKRKAELAARVATDEAGVATLERRLLEAQMATLQAQVEPHFLFNTLALIGQLIETNPAEAARVHMHLIDYLRATLPQMRSSGGGTLGRQVQLSRAYLAIMQARMKERLEVCFDVPDYLEQAPFPPMMLVTLIENAIKHGLEPKIEGGRITVTARLIDTSLYVSVRDNGVGFNMHANDGVGLANIRERLRLLFDERAELIIEAPMDGGALATIRVPFSMQEKTS